MSPSSRSLRQPSCRRHKATGQAVVTLNGRDIYLGKHGSAPRQASLQTADARMAGQRRLRAAAQDRRTDCLGTSQRLQAFCQAILRRDGKPTVTYTKAAILMKFVGNGPYSRTLARDFGPLSLKAVQHQLVAADGSRGYVNAQTYMQKILHADISESTKIRFPQRQGGSSIAD